MNIIKGKNETYICIYAQQSKCVYASVSLDHFNFLLLVAFKPFAIELEKYRNGIAKTHFGKEKNNKLHTFVV